jgi:hypothetical protein
MANVIYCSKCRYGGTSADSLSFIDGTGLVDGDQARVNGRSDIDVYDDGIYYYRLNASSGATENQPYIVSPNTNAGNKRWIRQHPIINCYSTANGTTICGISQYEYVGGNQDLNADITGSPTISDQVFATLAIQEPSLTTGTFYVHGWSCVQTSATAWSHTLYIKSGNSSYALATQRSKSNIQQQANSGNSNYGVYCSAVWVGSLSNGDYVHVGGSFSGTGGTTKIKGASSGNIINGTGIRFIRLQ